MRDRKLYIGSGIRRLRDAKGMTQVDFASKLRISTAYLSQMETNQRPVSAAVLYGLTTASVSSSTNSFPRTLTGSARI